MGNFDVDLFFEFFQGFVNHADVTLHIDNLKGRNAHHQIETVFKAPLSFLIDPKNLRMQEFHTGLGKTRYVPSWDFYGHEIWGLTAWVIAEFLNLALDADIPTRPRPERNR